MLGYISPTWFNAGTMQLDAAAAASGIKRNIADPLGISAEQAAWGIHLVATSAMENALRLVSIERGRDPRRYAMVAFGGAGPLHAARMARSIGIPSVIVPYGAGVGSAIGLLEAEPRIDATATKVMRVAAESTSEIAAVYQMLEAQVRCRHGTARATRRAQLVALCADALCGQGFEVKVDLPDGPIDQSYADRAMQAFKEAYMRKNQFLDAEGAIEAVDWTLVGTILFHRPMLLSARKWKGQGPATSRAARGSRKPEATSTRRSSTGRHSGSGQDRGPRHHRGPRQHGGHLAR